MKLPYKHISVIAPIALCYTGVEIAITDFIRIYRESPTVLFVSAALGFRSYEEKNLQFKYLANEIAKHFNLSVVVQKDFEPNFWCVGHYLADWSLNLCIGSHQGLL